MVFELVLIFSVSIVIVTILYSAFSSYQDYYTSVGSGDSLNKVKQLISLHIIELAKKDSDSWTTVKIPDRIINDIYVVELSTDGLNVSTRDAFRSSPMYGLSTIYTLSGKVPSINGRITIYKTQDQIIIQ